jgi:NAD(P)H dehydrogenase (quinone)
MGIVVTGATGRLGRLVVENLLERGVAPETILATGRSVEKLADLGAAGVRTSALSFDAPVPDGVMEQGDVLLLVSGSEVGKRVDQHRNVIDAAARAGVSRIVYTSAPAADSTTLILAPEHAATERIIRESGLTFTFLRNGWYTENYRAAFDQAAASGVVLGSAGDGRVASAAIADYAEGAAAALLSPTYDDAVLELSGDTAWSFADLAATFAQVLGRDVVHRAVPPEDHRAALLDAGLDEGAAGFVVGLDANIADGLLGVTSGDLGRLIGRPTTPMPETVATWAS